MRYAEEHLWTHSTPNLGPDELQQQKTPPLSLLLAKNNKLRLQITQDHRRLEKAWSDESWFLLWHKDSNDRICRKQHESMDSSCLVSTGQVCGVMVWEYFLAHFGPLSTKWALFEHHSLEYCCWPHPSLYDQISIQQSIFGIGRNGKFTSWMCS